MGNRAWNIVAWVIATPYFFVAIALWLVFAAACVFVVVAGAADIFEATDSWGVLWQKVALLIIFVRLILAGRRVRKLDDKIDQIRMCVFSTINYLNIEFRNRRTDLPPGLGAQFKDDLEEGSLATNYWRVYTRPVIDARSHSQMISSRGCLESGVSEESNLASTHVTASCRAAPFLRSRCEEGLAREGA